MLDYRIIPVTPLQQNCTLLWCTRTMEAAVIDPGGDLNLILEAVEQAGAAPVKTRRKVSRSERQTVSPGANRHVAPGSYAANSSPFFR